MKGYFLIVWLFVVMTGCASKHKENQNYTSEDCSVKDKLVEFNSLDYFISNMDIKYEFDDTIKIILSDTSYYPYAKMAYFRLKYLANMIYPCIEDKYNSVYLSNNFMRYNIENNIIYSKEEMIANYNKFQQNPCLTEVTKYVLKNFNSDDLIKFNFLIEQINSLGEGYNEKEIIDIIEGYAVESKDIADGYYQSRLRALGVYTKAVIPQKLDLINSIVTVCGEDSISDKDVKYLKLYKKQSK